ncbi:MAG TPA: SRPBCC domain-containing protein, partial [Micromonosporaceae bacterium]|nr:SRPBCC domain-containing protein [Micromonosporaceae bacterium]
GTAADMAVSGEYLEVDAPRRLVFTWQWAGEDERTTVTVEIGAAGAGSELVLVHDRFASQAACDEHAQGWNDCLDRLPTWLSAPTVAA